MTNVFSVKRFLIVLCLLCCALPGFAADISISSAKLLPDSTNTTISISSKVVTYAAADYFYIVEDNQIMGIRVEKVGHGLSVGMRADITGTMTTTTDNERAILASIATQTPAPNATGTIAPICMNNLPLGGADWRVEGTGGQRGVTGVAFGLNNIGLLVKTWGRYQQVDATTFTIDGGSGLNIRCRVAPGTTLSSAWEYVTVIGISSLYKSNSATYLPMVLVRDIQVYLPVTNTEMVYIPASSFLMGTPDSYTASHSSDEHPQHSVYLSGYWIGKYEVTRGEYRAFMTATGRAAPAYWAETQTWNGQTFTQTENHPVVGVTYDDAQAYCAWAGGRLPTEAEWEKAARWTGSYPNVYPWGDTWDAQKCNNYYDTNPAGGGNQRFQTAPVGSYPSGASPYGCQDMAGNVLEWVGDWYKSYPGSSSPFDYTNNYRVLRGGSWSTLNGDYYARAAYRYGSYPSYYDLYYFGFRLAR